MKRVKILKWMLLGVATLVLGTVIAFVVWAWPALYVPPVRDFRLIGLERVSSERLGPCDDANLECLKTLPYDEYLRIRVTTDRNLMDLAAAHELNLWKEVWSCDSSPDRYAMSEFIAAGPHVREYALPYGSSREAERFYTATGTSPGSVLAYDIYLVPRRSETSNAYEGTKERAPPYDISNGRDICLRIGGGNMLGGRFVGNTVRVTSTEMRAAMSRG